MSEPVDKNKAQAWGKALISIYRRHQTLSEGAPEGVVAQPLAEAIQTLVSEDDDRVLAAVRLAYAELHRTDPGMQLPGHHDSLKALAKRMGLPIDDAYLGRVNAASNEDARVQHAISHMKPKRNHSAYSVRKNGA